MAPGIAAFLFPLTGPAEPVLDKGEETGKFVGGVDVFLDDVEGEIVEAAKAPDGQAQEDSGLPFGIVQQEEQGGGAADDGKEQGFELDPKGIGQVFHARESGWLIEQGQNGVGGALRGAGFAEGGNDAGELGFYFLAARGILEEIEGGAGDFFGGDGGLQELGIDLLVGEEVGHGEGGDGDKVAGDLIVEPGGFVERHGGHTKEGAFHGNGAGFADGDIGADKGARQVINLEGEVGKELTGGGLGGEERGGGSRPLGGRKLAGEFAVDNGEQVVRRQNHDGAGGGKLGEDEVQGFQHGGKMPFQFALAAAGQEENLGRAVFGGRFAFLAAQADFLFGEASDHGVADEFDAEAGSAAGVPLFFKREDTQEKVVVLGEQLGAARPGGPDLGRDELDDFGFPLGKRIAAKVFPDSVAEAEVEAAVVDADDDIRLAANGDGEQLLEEAAEFEDFEEDIGDAHDGEVGHVSDKFHSGGSHAGSAGAETNGVWHPCAQAGYQFGGEEVATGFAGHEQEGFRFHIFISAERRGDAKPQITGGRGGARKPEDLPFTNAPRRGEWAGRAHGDGRPETPGKS